MKTRLLQSMYVNPFAGLEHENSYTNLTKFYKNFGMLGALETEDEVVPNLFPRSIISKENGGI